MMTRILAAVGLVACMATAAAQGFNTTSSECAQLKASADRDGVLCAVDTYMGKPALFIKVLTKENDAPKKVERAKHVVGVLHRNFYADGGTQVLTRTTDKAGRDFQRYCFRNGRHPNGYCNEWAAVSGSSPIAETK